jgi:hypothetical protein
MKEDEMERDKECIRQMRYANNFAVRNPEGKPKHR